MLVRRALTLLLAVFVLSSCRSYWSDRLADLHECVQYDFQFGWGLSVDARVSRFGGCVGLTGRNHTFGKPDWWQSPRGYYAGGFGLPFGQLVAPIAAATRGSPYLAMFGVTQIQTKSRSPYLEKTNWEDDENLLYGRGSILFLIHRCGRRDGYSLGEHVVDAFGVDASVFVGVAGVRVGFNPAEFADFLCGWFGLDLLDSSDSGADVGDDAGQNSEQSTPRQEGPSRSDV